MKATTCFIFAAFLLFEAQAQQNCKRISFFFESDQSDLTEASEKRLDSLLSSSTKPHYMAELYGHADTVGSSTYNYSLAMRRMKTIEGYLNSKSKNKFDYKEKNFSETQETNAKIPRNEEAALAYNRRVDLYLIPMKGDMLEMKGNKNETVDVPADYFEPCGLCGNKPSIKSYYSEEDTRNTNITFTTSDGFQLVTAGTLVFNFTPCNGVRKKDTATLVFRICDGKPDEKMSLWQADTIKGKVYWKPSNNKFVLNQRTGCYEFRAPAGQLFNLDKKVEQTFVIVYDTTFRIILPKEFSYQHTIVTDTKKAVRYNSRADSVGIRGNETSYVLYGFGKTADRIYLMTTKIDSLPMKEHLDGRHYYDIFRPAITHYEELTYSDTTIKIKRGKFAQKATFGFYLPEYKEFIPMDSTKGKYMMSNSPNCNFQYGYLKGTTLYVIKDKDVKEKYIASKNMNSIKFGRKSKKNFKRVNDYRPK
ncbi:MAG: OmpA family protein [Bacteroidota bacterium]|nr:OmpA family protein [Bacteroidota bacterium]